MYGVWCTEKARNFPWPKVDKINPNFRKHTLAYYKFLALFERNRTLDIAEGIGLGRKYDVITHITHHITHITHITHTYDVWCIMYDVRCMM